MLVCAALMSAVFAQPSKEKEAKAASKPAAVRAAVLNGPSGMGLAYMFENTLAVDGVGATYEVCATPDVLLPKLLKGELDIGILPPNAAAKVYTKNNGAIVMGGVTGFGMLSLITKDASVTSLNDLCGKTVHVAGQGSTPEYMIRYLLRKNGIAVTDDEAENARTAAVTLDFSIPASELAAAVISGKAQYALVPEPFATVATAKDGTVRRALNIQGEWEKIHGEGANYPMTVIVVNAAFAKAYPETVRAFLREAEKSIEWTVLNAAEAGALVEKHTLGLKAAVAASAIPNCAFMYKGAAAAQKDMEALLSVFASFAPSSIGGALPDSSFYFE